MVGAGGTAASGVAAGWTVGPAVGRPVAADGEAGRRDWCRGCDDLDVAAHLLGMHLAEVWICAGAANVGCERHVWR